MGPKKKTKSARSTKDDKTIDPWVQELMGKAINENNWRCQVTIMIESNASVAFYNKLLNAYCADKSSTLRSNINIISYSDVKQSVIFDQAVESSDHSKVKPYNKLCAHLNEIMQGQGDRAGPLASFIKYKILESKEESLARIKLMEDFKKRENADEEEKRNIIDEILAKGNTDSRQKQSKAKKTSTPKKLSQKDGRKKTAGKSRETRKFTTILKRGHEFLENSFIEDAPENGPQMYVVLTGFLEPDLPLELLALGVPLVGVLKLNTALLTSDINNFPDQTEIIDRLKLDENLFNPNSIHASRQSKNDNSYQDFWRHFFVLLINHENDRKFENVMFYPFSFIFHQEDHTDLTEIMTDLSKQVYNHISLVQYKLSEIIDDRLVYLGSLKQVQVEEHSSKDSIDLSEYNRLLNSIPPDCVEVYHILEALLQQITNETSIQEVHCEHDHEKIEQLIPRVTDGDVNRKTSIIGEFKLSRIGSQIAKLEEIYDLTPKHDSSGTVGKVDEQGVVFDREDRLGISLYRHRDNRNPIFENDAIKLLKTFWRKYFNFEDDVFLENNYENFCKREVVDESTEQHRNVSSSLLSDFHDQTENLRRIEFSSVVRGSHNRGPFAEFESDSEDYYVIDENVFGNLSTIPCGHENVSIEDKKMNFCFDALNLDEKNDNLSMTCENNNKFCYSEIRHAKYMVQHLLESVGEYACLDIKKDDKLALSYVKFHTLCSLPEKTLAGSLRSAVCLRDFLDFIVPENVISSQTDHVKESSMENAIMLENSNYQHDNSDRWCLDEDFIDVNSLKRPPQSIRVDKNSFMNRPNSAPVEKSEQIDFGADTITNQLDNCSETLLDSFELGSSKFLNFSEKINQFRLSKTFTTKIRILNDPFSGDSVAIEPTISDCTLYFYIRLKWKVNDIKFHIRHKTGMIIYFERAPIANRDSGLLKSAQPRVFMKSKSKSEDRVPEEILDTEQQKQQLCYRFSLSWPSCLHLEFINENQLFPAYIKQWYSVPKNHTNLLDEEKMRCYTHNGEILKFMKDGSVVVFYPNGRIFYDHHMMSRQSLNSSRKSNYGEELNSPSNVDAEEKLFYEYSKKAPDFIQYEQTFQSFANGSLKSELSNGVVVTHTYDGDLVVDFPDGSRITTSLNCVSLVVVDDDEIFETYSPSNNDFDELSDNENSQFVLISTHYLIEHACFASVSFRDFENKIKVGLPHGLSISINRGKDMFEVKLNDESRIEIEKCEINIFNGNSIRSTIFLSNIQEYSKTFPQYEKYEFFNCNVDSKCVLLLDSWGEMSTDRLYFDGNCEIDLDNMYYIVRNDLSGYKIYPGDFESKLDVLTGERRTQCVINESADSLHKSALFIEPSEPSCEWRMTLEPYSVFERSQSTFNCCRFLWLNPITLTGNKTSSKGGTDPALLTIGLLEWFKCREQSVDRKPATFRNKNNCDLILKNYNYAAAMEIYEKGNRMFVSERQQVVDQAETIVSETIRRVQSIFSRREKLNKINKYKQLIRNDTFCNYFNTKVGMSFSLADEIVTHAIKTVEPREIGKLISFSVTEELIRNAIEMAEIMS